MDTMLHENSGSNGIRLKDDRLLMDLPSANRSILPAGADDTLSLSASTHPILQHLCESQALICLKGGLLSIPMILLLKVATMRLSSSDDWELVHFGALVF